MTEKFLYNATSDGDVLECESCGSEAPLRVFGMGVAPAVNKRLCEICANSQISNVTHYREQYKEDTVITARLMANVGNTVMDKIIGRGPKKHNTIIVALDEEEETVQ